MSKGIWNKTKDKLNRIHKIWTDLDSPLLSTQQIAKQTGMDWHTAGKYLEKLEGMDLVKKLVIKTKDKKMTFWEKKKGLKEKTTESIES